MIEARALRWIDWKRCDDFGRCHTALEQKYYYWRVIYDEGCDAHKKN
jgi:hypothetical protein